MHGRTVRMYMADGTALGIRQCEILNRTIQSLSVSRARLPELFSWHEIEGIGVYFLFGRDDQGGELAYIGEGQRVIERLRAHLREKAFWNEAVVFVNKDENINSKYLEARLIQDAIAARRYSLENGKSQVVPGLSRAETAAMEEIIPDIRLILGVLGYRILDPLFSVPTEDSAGLAVGTGDALSSSILGREFEFSGPGFSAKGRVTDEGFVVLKDSSAAPEFKAGSAGYRQFRDKLIEDGAIASVDGELFFKRDVVTSSSSQAASIVAGGNRSGPGSWKSGSNTLGDFERALADRAGP